MEEKGEYDSSGGITLGIAPISWATIFRNETRPAGSIENLF
ncbi:hypothetical protein [Bacillus atrophaeus]|nr:hypothetical protein [Bacillus atrophaeus]